MSIDEFGAGSASRPGLGHFLIDVLTLRPEVMEEPGFKAENPGYVSGSPCVYVGQTGVSVAERVGKHLSHPYQSNRFVRKYFVEVHAITAQIPPVHGRGPAEQIEAQTAELLRERGWGVWQK